MQHWFDYIVHHMRLQPEKPALVMENRVATYGMLKAGMERCARRIADLGLAREAPVAVLYKDPIRHLTLCLALHRIGIASLSLEYGQSGIEKLKPACLLGDGAARNAVAPGGRLVDVTDDWFGADLPGASALPKGFADPGEVCHQSLTSGTTGEPKLVALSIANIGRRFDFFFSADWTTVLCLPGLSTMLGFGASCAALAGGRTLCFAQSPFQAIRMIELFSIDFVSAATEQLVALTRVARKTGARLETLRTVHVCGSMPTRALLEAAALYVCRDIQNRYAMTELGNIAHGSALEILRKPGFAGHIEPGLEVGIFDADGSRCARGTIGRVKVRHDAPGEDWVDAGDVGWIAAEDELYIVGRSTDADAAAAQVSPVHEIEHLLRLEWDIADAGAVLVEPRAPAGRAQIWIGTVDNKDATAEKLEAVAKARGLDCAIELFALNAIPRTANGKIHRAQLKTLLAAMRAGGKAATGAL